MKIVLNALIPYILFPHTPSDAIGAACLFLGGIMHFFRLKKNAFNNQYFNMT